MPSPRRPRSRASKIASASGAVVLVLLAAELYLRIFAPVYYLDPRSSTGPDWPLAHRRSDEPNLDYELSPGAEVELDDAHVVVNSLGMRDDEPMDLATPGLRRIFVLGDSISFGWRIEHEQCYSEVLQHKLNEEGRVVDVLNFGVSGYSTENEVDQLAARLDGLAGKAVPELVIVGYCLNDPAPPASQPLPRYFQEPAWWQYLNLARLVARKLHEQRVERFGDGDYYRFLHAPDGPMWPAVEVAFDRLGALAAQYHFSVIVVVFPWGLLEDWDTYEYADLHAQVADAAKARGFEAIDLLDRYQKREPLDLVFSTYDMHPTVVGHAIAAKALLGPVRQLLDERDARNHE